MVLARQVAVVAAEGIRYLAEATETAPVPKERVAGQSVLAMADSAVLPADKDSAVVAVVGSDLGVGPIVVALLTTLLR